MLPTAAEINGARIRALTGDPIGIGIIERLRMEAPRAKVHIASIVHENVAWDIALRHLRTFTKDIILFAFRNSDVYDAGAAGIYHATVFEILALTANCLSSLFLHSAGRYGRRKQKS